MPSAALNGFFASFKDTERLFAIYERERLAQPPAVPSEIEVLKRAAFLLLVTAWETYVEDLLREKFAPRLAQATSPDQVQNAFDLVAYQWGSGNKSPQTSLAAWTGDGWKTKVTEYFETQVGTFNTPNGRNCSRLLKTFLDVDTSKLWKWPGHTGESATKRLDEIVALRGELAHVARRTTGTVPTKHPVSRDSLERAMKFIKELATATDKIP